MHPQRLPDPPGAVPPYRWRNGYQYWCLPLIARHRGITPQAAGQWARRHPELTLRFGKHTYARNP